jgi:hypothetical protein
VTRRVTVAAVVAVLCTVVATVHAEPASAYYDAITTAPDWEVVNGWLNGQADNPVTEYTKTRPAQGNTWLKARRVLGRIPKLGATGSGTIALGVGALWLGWEIPHTTGASDWIYGQIAGVNGQAQPTAGTIRAYAWKVQVATGTIYSSTTGTWSPSAPDCGEGPLATACWVPTVRYSVNSGSTWSERPGYIGSGCVSDGPGVTFCDAMSGWTYSHNGAKWSDTEAAIHASLQGSGFSERCRTYSAGGGDVAMDCVYTRTLTEMTDNVRAVEQRAYNATTDAARKNYTDGSSALTQPGPSYGSTEQAAIEALIESDDDLAEHIGTILNPTTGGAAETIALPQPRYGETGAQYRQRLRNLGFLGTVVLEELDLLDALPEFGPNVVTRVGVGASPATTWHPLLAPWPDPGPTIPVPGQSTTIRVEHNPQDAPAPGPGAPGSPSDPPPGNAPPPGGGGTITVGDCECPAPDFGPLTDVDYGEKFPFGVFTLVVGTLGTTLYASPDAPVFAFENLAGTTHDYTVDLSVLDAYASTIRTLIAWVIWVGGLWYFGTRWLGFRGSGDPGAAVDEAWDGLV